jgi:hypothetical protein
MPTKQDAIKAINKSRQTHVQWVAWFKEHPDEEIKYAQTAGDTEHHEKCIARYDMVLSYLDSLPEV